MAGIYQKDLAGLTAGGDALAQLILGAKAKEQQARQQKDLDIAKAGEMVPIELDAQKQKNAQTLEDLLGATKRLPAGSDITLSGGGIRLPDPRANEYNLNLTPAQKAVDMKFGKEYADYYTEGGKASIDKDLEQLRKLPERLEATDMASGPFVGILPKFARDVIAPDASSIQDEFEQVAQKTLKKILGGQFAQQEAKEFFARAYNPRLSEAENSKRIKASISELENMTQDKENAARYYEQHGTLAGFKPRLSAPLSTNRGTGEDKEIVKQQRNKRTGQIKITYSDGSTEIK